MLIPAAVALARWRIKKRRDYSNNSLARFTIATQVPITFGCGVHFDSVQSLLQRPISGPTTVLFSPIPKFLRADFSKLYDCLISLRDKNKALLS